MRDPSRNDPLSLEQLLRDLREHVWSVNWKAADALARIGQEAFPHLLKALEDPDGYVRNGAAIALGKIGNKEAIEPLLRALRWRDDRVHEDDEDQEARCSAAIALGKLRDQSLCGPLLQELEKTLESNANLASYIVEALGEIANPQAIPILARMFENRDPDVQKLAAWALWQMGSAGVEVLLRIVRDRSSRGRGYAIRALGVAKSEIAIPALKEILKDRNDDKFVRGHAARALGEIGKDREVMSALLEILESSEDEVKIGALRGLGYLRDPSAYETIVKHLENVHLRYTAVMALGDLGAAKACDLLISMLKSEDYSLRSHAVTAIGKIGCSNAVPALVELRDQKTDSPSFSWERSTVERVIEALRDKEQSGVEPPQSK